VGEEINTQELYSYVKWLALALLIFSIVFAGQEHTLLEVTPVNADLNMSGFNITAKGLRIGNSQSSYIHFSEDASGAGFSIVFDGAGDYLYIKGGSGSVGSQASLLRMAMDSKDVAILGSSGTFSVAGSATMNSIVLSDDDITGVDEIKGSGVLRLYGDATGGPDIYVSAAGNVGIGKTPESKLDVSGDGAFSGDLAVVGGDIDLGANAEIDEVSGNLRLYSSGYVVVEGNDATHGLRLKEIGGAGYANIEARNGVLGVGFNTGDGPLMIGSNCVRVDSSGAGCSVSEGLVVDGSVGIGTGAATPSSKLEVVGSMEVGGLLGTDGNNFFRWGES